MAKGRVCQPSCLVAVSSAVVASSLIQIMVHPRLDSFLVIRNCECLVLCSLEHNVLQPIYIVIDDFNLHHLQLACRLWSNSAVNYAQK
jgi:hypothetical protein